MPRGSRQAHRPNRAGWIQGNRREDRATRDRAQASALYLLFYYLGSSLLGSAGGLAWNHAAWLGVAGFALILTLVAFMIAIRLRGGEP